MQAVGLKADCRNQGMEVTRFWNARDRLHPDVGFGIGYTESTHGG